MSSILRALKKLESDSRHLDDNRALDSKFVPLADTGPRRSGVSIVTMIGAGIICGLVVLAGWYLFSDRLQPQQSEPRTIPPSNSSPARVAQNQLPNVNNIPDKTVAETPEGLSLNEPPEALSAVEKPVAAEPAGMAEPAINTDGQEDVLSADEPLLEETDPAGHSPAAAKIEPTPEPAGPAAEAAGSSPPPALETAAEAEIPKLKDPDMKLQAITWSKVPQKRIAVINNRIVREGEPVSGYLIRTINQDDVVLSRDGEKWQLLFRRR